MTQTNESGQKEKGSKGKGRKREEGNGSHGCIREGGERGEYL